MRKEQITTEFGQPQAKRGARGTVSYSVEVFHQGLNRHRVIRGPDAHVIEAKVRLQAAQWNALWAAAERTAHAQEALQSVHDVLRSSLGRSAVVDWDTLKDRSVFPSPAPVAPAAPSPPELERIPDAPLRTSPRYQAELGLLDKLIASRRLRSERLKTALFESDMTEWETNKARIVADHAAKKQAHQSALATLEAGYWEAVKKWEAERDAYLAKQDEQHRAIEAFRTRYKAKDPSAIAEYCDLVLAKSEYPDCVPKEFDLDFNHDNGMLVVNYRLPAPSDMPTLNEVKYVRSTDSFVERYLSETNAAKLYDDLIYQLALRTMNELLDADQVSSLANVVFNGFVTAVDKATGNEVTSCIISVQASKDTLRAINLAKVEPKACFRQLKGVGSSTLHSVTPVAPIIELRKDDERFIPSYGVAGTLNEGFNLASMDWEDFEHLVREIFEREFTSTGGEVKVTQASRDGGVDAIAFDRDPIRGGKIVIQAKRYTHTVGVWAVRDLYGTLMNEGATKGILVTTSDYGPDAYEFANGKPITLLNGANLLHLLEKHGTKAHINLAEARQAGFEDRKR